VSFVHAINFGAFDFDMSVFSPRMRDLSSVVAVLIKLEQVLDCCLHFSLSIP
jgi:hypothetical protein